MKEIQSVANQVLVNLAIGMIGLLGAYALFYLQKAVVRVKAETEKLKSAASRELLLDALADVANLVSITVESIEQTTASALRAAVKDGTTDREELLALGKKAFDSVKSRITPEAQMIINENLGSFNEYLSNMIEAKVLELKASGNA